MEQALAGLNCQVIQSTSDEAPGLLAYVEHHLGAHHSPDLFHVQHELSKAVSAPWPPNSGLPHKAVATGGRDAQAGARAPRHDQRRVCHSVGLAVPRREPRAWSRSHKRWTQRATSTSASARSASRSPRASVPSATPTTLSTWSAACVATASSLLGISSEHIDTIRTIAQQEHLSETCLDRIEKAERVVPKMQATIEFVSGYVRQQVRQLDLAPPVSYAMHAHLIPSYYLERVASTRTVTEGEPLRALAERLRTPLFEPGGALGALSPMEQNQLKHKATTLAEVFQRSSSNVEGRNGYLSLRNHQLRGLDHPRKRACLTAMHNFFLTRPDGTTAAERFFGQKPRVDVCCDLGIRRDTASASQSTAASPGIDQKAIGWPTP